MLYCFITIWWYQHKIDSLRQLGSKFKRFWHIILQKNGISSLKPSRTLLKSLSKEFFRFFAKKQRLLLLQFFSTISKLPFFEKIEI